DSSRSSVCLADLAIAFISSAKIRDRLRYFLYFFIVSLSFFKVPGYRPGVSRWGLASFNAKVLKASFRNCQIHPGAILVIGAPGWRRKQFCRRSLAEYTLESFDLGLFWFSPALN